jgi:Bacteriophage tail sheath protein
MEARMQTITPGIVIAETPSAHDVAGVATSCAAFVDFFTQGPLDMPVPISSFADFERRFGGLVANSEAGYAIQQFYLNGGNQAIVVRVMSPNNPAISASVALDDENGTALLTATAIDPGAWGNNLRIAVDYGGSANFFTLNITQVSGTDGAQIVAAEKFSGLVIDPSKANDAAAMVNANSNLIRLVSAGANNRRPAQTQYVVGSAVAGTDGKWNDGADYDGMTKALIGDPNRQTGLYALNATDLFNILCIPATMSLPDNNAFKVATDAAAFCTQRRAFYLLDAPQQAANRDSVTAITSWLGANDSLRGSSSALYFPRLIIADPLAGYGNRAVAPSGTMAGIYARTDASGGVWKAPAGAEATLAGVVDLACKLSDADNDVLNPLAINCLRNFAVYGPIAWGARTLKGADAMADDYKYIPVRRLALYIEASVLRGTQWVVFEPNGEPLWAQLRLAVGSFLQGLYRQGAFFGATAAEAYFTTCDATNNPPDTINQGFVNITIGFAPERSAEFVVIQIQQAAGSGAS